MQRHLGQRIGVFGLVLAVCLGLQWAGGAFESDFSMHPDEPAHVVSSLLVADYLTEGAPQNPVEFAERYYVRYPKVGIGHWPPLFYALEGSAMSVMGRTRTVLVCVQAVLAAALAAGVFFWALGDYGGLAAIASAAVLLSAPLVHKGLLMVTPDMLLAAVAMAAAWAWSRYVQTGRRKDGVVFAVAVVAALATHQRGLALAFLPVFWGALASPNPAARRRWRLAAILLALVAFVPNFFRVNQQISLLAVLLQAGKYVQILGSRIGWPVLAMAAVGAFAVYRDRQTHPHLMAAPALLSAGFAFHTLTGTPLSDYYLLPAAPAAAVLFAGGWAWSLTRLFSQRRLVTAALIITAVITVGWNLSRLRKKQDLGYQELVSRSIAREAKISLVAGSAVHEGSFIAEMALADPGLERVVLRGSKALSSSSWAGRNFKLRYGDVSQVRDLLDRNGVSLVVVQSGRRPLVQQLLAAVAGDPDNWSAAPPEALPAGSRFFKDARVFVRSGPAVAVPDEIRIEMQDRLGRDLVLPNP